MSFIKTRDQAGNPIPFMNVRIAEGTKSSDDAYDDKFSDDAGNLSFVMHMPGAHTLYANYRSVDMERFILEKYHHNEGPRWGIASKYVDDLDAAEITLVLARLDAPVPPGSNCPVNYDKTQFTNWFNSIKVGSGPTIPNMIAMKPALVTCGFEWQNMCRSTNEWRPRIHQPPFLNGPCSGSTHDVDCGDLPEFGGGPWKLTFRY